MIQEMRSAAVAVIGGADGPTAIYVATSISPWFVGIAVAAVVAVAVLAIVLVRRRKHKK